MYCSKCGAQISDNVAACPYCGQPTGAQQESAGAYQSGGYQQGGTGQSSSSGNQKASGSAGDILRRQKGETDDSPGF